jgi:DNA-binding XRE family transcriptional regulator
VKSLENNDKRRDQFHATSSDDGQRCRPIAPPQSRLHMSSQRRNPVRNPVSSLELRRRELGLTQAELASLVGVQRAEVSRYERGLLPGIAVRERIAGALESSLSELWPGTGARPQR